MKKTLILIIICLFFLSCQPKYPIDLGDNFRLDYNSVGYTSLYRNANSIVLYGDVLKYAFDENFILIENKPIDVIEATLKIKKCTNYADRKKYGNNSSLREYWIINKNELALFDSKLKRYSNLYGPFNANDFLNKRIELKVLKTLKLIEIH